MKYIKEINTLIKKSDSKIIEISILFINDDIPSNCQTDTNSYIESLYEIR